MEALVLATQFADNLSSVVRYALETTRATMTCPFHWNVIIRVGDDAAESHAIARARNIIRSDGTRWEEMALRREFDRQLRGAADRYCPQCSYLVDDPSI
jgi:alkyl hydroperoxide reductase subunit AhpF